MSASGGALRLRDDHEGKRARLVVGRGGWSSRLPSTRNGPSRPGRGVNLLSGCGGQLRAGGACGGFVV